MPRMSFKEADTLHYYLLNLSGVTKAVVYERTADAVVEFKGDRQEMITALKRFHFDEVEVPDVFYESSGREINAIYKDKLISSIMKRFCEKMFVPVPIRAGLTIFRSIKFLAAGIKALAHKRLDVSVLDATAIGVSIIRGDTDTASSVMFLLGIGETMEEWSHKKSVNDLAKSMALNIENVWLKTDTSEVLVPADKIKVKDHVVIHMGNVVPFDGTVISGEGMVNQASLTGESLPVRRKEGGYVYAGTVLEEGELTIEVKEAGGSSRYEKIISVIEENEKLKSDTESRTEHLADALVPYTLAGTALVGLITRNVTKTLAVLMVDFSCALKLSMPITVLSAMSEANKHHITVKGGKFIEAMAEAKTIVFDKTGTLTKACPTVEKVIPFCDRPTDELLKIAACLEEHFPHSMAKAVVKAAEEKGLIHEEMHTKIEYIVSHGIASTVEGKRVVIGSYHFIFEDEHCTVDPAYKEAFDNIPMHYSTIYMAIDNVLSAVLCIADPLRDEAADVIKELRDAGFEKIVMMTGDRKVTASAVAEHLDLDDYYAEVLPEQKAAFVEKERALGHKVAMIGDGINDSPALSAADIGIAISDGAQIAREIADVTISGNDLRAIVTLKRISTEMVKRVNRNYRMIVGINGALIALGVGGVIAPTTSATLHNLSTLGISMSSMAPLLPEDTDIDSENEPELEPMTA